MSEESPYIHIWTRCHACGAEPISGVRFECEICPSGPDNDLCEKCYRQFEQGNVKHPVVRRGAGAPLRHGHTFRPSQGKLRSEYSAWLAVPYTPRVPPSIADRFLIRPEFRCGRQSFLGTYGFAAVGLKDEHIILTALHVLDDIAKTYDVICSEPNASYTGKELPEIITQVNLYDGFADNWVFAELGVAGKMLVLPKARTGDPEPHSSRDVAGFDASHELRLNPRKMAFRDPEVGESLWLVANQKGKRCFEAVVIEPVRDSVIFRFTSKEPLEKNTSGAPLVNENGEVVGINVGAGTYEGHWFGHGNHVSSIRSHLKSAESA